MLTKRGRNSRKREQNLHVRIMERILHLWVYNFSGNVVCKGVTELGLGLLPNHLLMEFHYSYICKALI